jgi:predicted ATPase
VVIEEPEMGLHPRAISTFLLLVLELMKRGYRVVISTHSTVVLDLVWGINKVKLNFGTEKDVRNLFELKSNNFTKELAASAIDKSYKVYFFEKGQQSKDISTLDPGDADPIISNWGDLNGFASRTAEVVARVVNRALLSTSKK